MRSDRKQDHERDSDATPVMNDEERERVPPALDVTRIQERPPFEQDEDERKTEVLREKAEARKPPQPPRTRTVAQQGRTRIAPPAARLISLDPSIPLEATLRGELTTIGRSADCDIFVDHDSVSRRHAKIERRGSEYFITDLGSKNGILINGRVVRSGRLKHGCTLEIGTVPFRFLNPAAAKRPSLVQLGGWKVAVLLPIVGFVALVLIGYLLQKGPRACRAKLEQAERYIQNGDWAAGTKLLGEVMNQGNTDQRRRAWDLFVRLNIAQSLQNAERFRSQNEFSKALVEYRNALKFDPTNQAAAQGMQECETIINVQRRASEAKKLARTADTDAAISALDALLEEISSAGIEELTRLRQELATLRNQLIRKKQIADLEAKALQNCQRGDHQSELETLRALVRLDPTEQRKRDLQALEAYCKGTAAFAAGDHDAARKYLATVPPNDRHYRLARRILDEMEQSAREQEALSSALQLVESGDLDGAARKLSLVPQSPRTAGIIEWIRRLKATIGMASNLKSEGKYAEAVQYYQHARDSLNPNSALRRKIEAEIEDLKPRLRPELDDLAQRGIAAWKQYQAKGRLTREDLTKTDEKSCEKFDNLARLLREAYTCLSIALQDSLTRHDSWNTTLEAVKEEAWFHTEYLVKWGYALKNEGRRQEALFFLRRALQMPDFPENKWHHWAKEIVNNIFRGS